MWKSYVALFTYLVFCALMGYLITRIIRRECVSPKCIQKNKLILSSMNSRIHPCRNFYKYICGKYKGLQTGDVEVSILEEMKKNQIRRLISFLNEPITNDQNRVLRVLKMIYKSCLDTGKIDREGNQPLLNLIQQSGGFPLLEGEKWDHKLTGNDLVTILYTTRYAGFLGGHIFESSIASLNGKYYVHITPPKLLEYVDSHADDYFKYVKKISKLLNHTHSADREKEINDTLQFKRELAQIHRMGRSCTEKFTYLTVDKFSKKFASLGLEAYLKNMLPYTDLPQYVIVTYATKGYFNVAGKLLEKTPKRIVANYLMIENIIEVTAMLPTPFRDARNELFRNTKYYYTFTDRSREMVCVTSIKGKMSSALSALYLKEKIGEYRKQNDLVLMLTSLKKEMKNLIKKLKWMDSKTKRKALKKVNVFNFAAPVAEDMFHDLSNKTSFNIYYEDLCFTGSIKDSLSGYMELQAFKTDKNWELLDRPIEVFDEDVDIFSAEVKFDHVRNLVIIPIGFLRYPAFDDRWPHYLNYGGLGSKIAMELVRGIEFVGAKYDSRGQQKDWWSIEAKAEHKSQTRCFINQYNEYLKPRTTTVIKDPNCIQENVLGTAGVKIAYMSYVKYEQQRFFPERRLQHLTFSPDQLFFADFATFYCARKMSFFYDGMTEFEASKLFNEYQVIGSLRHLNYFSDKFGCAVNDSMNPSGKCEMWNSLVINYL